HISRSIYRYDSHFSTFAPADCTPDLFCFDDAPPSGIYTLSLHDALPIWFRLRADGRHRHGGKSAGSAVFSDQPVRWRAPRPANRSEEHTSELQSDQTSYAVFCLKKKKARTTRRAPSPKVFSVAFARKPLF